MILVVGATGQVGGAIAQQLLVEAAAAAGVKQFIFISASLADANSPVPFLAAKGKTEALLITGAMPYTILAPDAFMDFWLGVIVGVRALQGSQLLWSARASASTASSPAVMSSPMRPPSSTIRLTTVEQFARAMVGQPTVRQ